MIHGTLALPVPVCDAARASRQIAPSDLDLGVPTFSNPAHDALDPGAAGNHDDPAGAENLSAIDLLSTCGLVNYFGKHVLTGSGTGKIKIKPVLMRKGNTKLALYGLGYIRDARLHQMFSIKGNVEWARPEDKPGFSSKSWFNTMLIHQNRVHHSPKNAISERYLPSWLDLVVWGHEHECLVEPTEYGDFMVSQPGSSVVTSLIEGEAKQKQVMILEVKADKHAPDDAPMWRTVPQPLETVRPFKYRQIALIDFARLAKEDGGLGPDFTPESGEANAGLGAKGKWAQPSKHEAWITTALERMVHELIAEARAPYERRGESEVPLPLIRLRVDYGGGFSTINAQRFGQKFVGKVANPNDLLQFFKSAARRRREDAGDAADAAAARETAVEDIIGNPTMQDQARIEQLVAQNLTQGLQLLSETDLSNALDDFVNRDKSALENLIKDRLKETMKFVEENAGHEAEMITAGDAKDVTANVEKSIAEAVQQRLARTGATARAAAEAEAAAAAADDAAAITPRRAAAQEKEIIEHARRRAAATTTAVDGDGDGDDDLGTVAPSEQPSAADAFREIFNTQASRGTRAGGGRAGGGRAGRGARGGRGSRASAAAAAKKRAASSPAFVVEDGEGEETDSGVDDEEIPATRPSRPSRAAAAVGTAASPGEVDIVPESDVDDDEEEEVPASRPVRARGRPTRAAAAVRRTRAAAAPDAFDFTEDTDDDDEVVEESGDDGEGEEEEEEAIAVVGRRGAKRKAPARAAATSAKRTRAGGGAAKRAPPRVKKSPPAKAPPGRTRAKRAVHIPYTQDEDSGEDDEEIPATATRRSTRAR